MLSAFLNRVFSFLTSNKKSTEHNGRVKLQEKFMKKNNENNKVSDFIDHKNQAMEDSQGTSDFSGSAYNGPGNVDHEKRNSNMGQRNFER